MYFCISWRNKVLKTFVVQYRRMIENTVQALTTAFHNTKVLIFWKSDSTLGLSYLDGTAEINKVHGIPTCA